MNPSEPLSPINEYSELHGTSLASMRAGQSCLNTNFKGDLNFGDPKLYDFRLGSSMSLDANNPWPERRQKISSSLEGKFRLVPITPNGDCFMSIIASKVGISVDGTRKVLVNELCFKAFGCSFDVSLDFSLIATDWIRALTLRPLNLLLSAMILS